jgi:hypothetical protein
MSLINIIEKMFRESEIPMGISEQLEMAMGISENTNPIDIVMVGKTGIKNHYFRSGYSQIRFKPGQFNILF